MNDLLRMAGRNIVVTGAARGIGRATAELLAALGANLTLVDRDTAAMDARGENLRGDHVLALPGSTTDRAFVDAVVAQGVERFGGVHGLVNNAGIGRAAMIQKMTAEDWQAVLDVNLTGSFNMLQAVGRDMIARAGRGAASPGAIVNIASDAGRKGTVGQINYGASKSGVLGLTMSAAREWGRYGIRVNSVAYGIVETDMTETVRGDRFRDRYLADIPLGRFLTPAEAAYSIAFLLAPMSAMITGQHLSVNGGAHMSA